MLKRHALFCLQEVFFSFFFFNQSRDDSQVGNSFKGFKCPQIPGHEQKPSKDSMSLTALRVPSRVLFGYLVEVLQKDPDSDEFRCP